MSNHLKYLYKKNQTQALHLHKIVEINTRSITQLLQWKVIYSSFNTLFDDECWSFALHHFQRKLRPLSRVFAVSVLVSVCNLLTPTHLFSNSGVLSGSRNGFGNTSQVVQTNFREKRSLLRKYITRCY